MGDFRTRIAGDYASVGAARRALRSYARLCGFSGDRLDDIETAVGEALANAAEHGSRGRAIDVCAWLSDDVLHIEIADAGPGFPASARARMIRPAPAAPRGYGIFLIHALIDDVAYVDGGRRLLLGKRLPRADGRAERA